MPTTAVCDDDACGADLVPFTPQSSGPARLRNLSPCRARRCDAARLGAPYRAPPAGRAAASPMGAHPVGGSSGRAGRPGTPAGGPVGVGDRGVVARHRLRHRAGRYRVPSRWTERGSSPTAACPRVCALVAYHSGAAVVAELLGLADQLAQFAEEYGPVRDALWYCDMTTSPDGRPVSFADRIGEIRARRQSADPVVRALAANGVERAAAVRRTEELLRRRGTSEWQAGQS